MNISLKIFMLVLLFLLLVFILFTIKDKKLTMRYGSFWIVSVIVMGIIVIWPNILFKLASFFGFEVPSNMILFLGLFFLFCVIFVFTISLSIQNAKIKTLVQEISLLKGCEKNGKKE